MLFISKLQFTGKLSIILSCMPMRFILVCFPYSLVASRIFIACWI